MMTELSSQFCQLAVNMGMVTEKQLNKAYVEQIEDDFFEHCRIRPNS